MTRRMGPGGRLRPAPRSNRNAPVRIDPPRAAAGYALPRAVDPAVGTPVAEIHGDAPERQNDLLNPNDDALDVDQPFFEQLDPGLIATQYPVADDTTRESHADVAAGEPETRQTAAVATQIAPGPNGQRSGADPSPHDRPQHDGRPVGPGGPRPQLAPHERPLGAPTCTAPQLRRFIKSRAYVPMHELRRRFAIDGGDDDVSQIQLDGTRIYVGLPGPEGRMLGDLVRGGEIGFELSMDPETPIVVGVYAMRPVPRG